MVDFVINRQCRQGSNHHHLSHDTVLFSGPGVESQFVTVHRRPGTGPSFGQTAKRTAQDVIRKMDLSPFPSPRERLEFVPAGFPPLPPIPGENVGGAEDGDSGPGLFRSGTTGIRARTQATDINARTTNRRPRPKTRAIRRAAWMPGTSGCVLRRIWRAKPANIAGAAGSEEVSSAGSQGP